MQLKIHNEGWVYFVISCLITIIIIPFYTILGILLCILSAYIFYFFRDPVRSIPGEKVIVSPADGLVTFIGITKNPLNDETDQNSYKKISIFLSVFDVHVNRMPVDAKISQIKYIPGKFINATLDKSSEENERNIILAENNNDKFYIVQIAGLIARRIVCSIKNNQEVNKGDRIGIIKFGSRVDLYLPENYNILVTKDQRVVGGETIISNPNDIKDIKTNILK
ncbi:MAG: phosphatidylserine decarboxylase family protein [Pelagibacteraceae bacterium]|jgi:phosphatidylserine decarboxylase|nr:phosphatidylserine decarboxylase family protein [Pelagibacteraceae bacterium]MBT5214010.1 phosphatidylserine decarboxylase family protein [Pelagibacteraceae bacterium]MBT6197686.1 phosphatidylserine decarboxylase family protein [Pelagibacteraceae bacterium]MBT6353569.1 phosphatidylserine decarboxylase family protein [Pelagibacteraceae bacterium]